VELGYKEIAARDPRRIQWIDATRTLDEVRDDIWAAAQSLLAHS
jgi:thymidylate kinase